MILTIIKLGWLNLRRDRVAQALTFALPIVFFSIFASVFGGQGSGTSRIRVGVVDEDHSELSARIVEGLRREPGLRVRTSLDEDGSGTLDRAGGEQLVRNGDVPVTVVIPKGLGANFGSSGFGGGGPSIELLADVSDKIAPQLLLGLLQKVTMTAAPDLLMRGGLAQFEKHAGALTDQQRSAVQAWLPTLKQQASGGSGDSSGSAAAMGVGVSVVDVMGSNTRRGSLISFYAAGIGVMFLLFSAVGGAGAALLEEVEAGTFERLLSTRIGMSGVLLGKWLFLAMMGALQLTIMFLWGAVVFELPLFSHLDGFLVMTVVTAAAAAALGLVLATLAKSRGQLQGFSTILILTMSAIGGSMFPRFLMSETMQKFGLLTFNGWALDGYLKVFWRELPIAQLWPQLLVLSALTIAFLFLARMFSRRWETV
jgi:ABC-2 type transport system permease protein